jgi:hypothetical protein
VVAGLPVLVSDQVDAATLFWGIPKQHVMFVQRKTPRSAVPRCLQRRHRHPRYQPSGPGLPQ